MKRSVAVAAIGLLALGAGEIFARVVLGLGTPPLTIAHPTIEYMFRPNQDVMRFGNRQLYNEYGMRSERLPAAGEEGIVLVIGDSVINGGNLTDHADLATTIAGHEDRHHFYANISAGNWGPGNQLAYLQNFGTFGADAAILVLNTDDIDDIPTFGPINPATSPLENPTTALGEAIMRYLPRYLPDAMSALLRPSVVQHPYPQQTAELGGPEYLVGLFSLFAETSIPVCIVLHRRLEEQEELLPQNLPSISDLASEWGIATVETWPEFTRGDDAPADFYRDSIHINEAGQAVLVGVLYDCINQAVIPYVAHD